MTTGTVAPDSRKYVGYFCSHTHWDREWYGTFQAFRMRLVRLVDRLLDLLERDPSFRCFNLDGQTIVLEDYLEVRPENRTRLETLICSGRIAIGPWYMLPDEWLVSGESTVRNLLRGRAICRDFGVEPPPVGYLPDMFGHISQIPQILAKWGIDNSIMWRGLSGEGIKTELWWESPDGSRVFTVHLPEHRGYGNAGFYYHSVPPEARTLPEDTPYGYMVTQDLDFTLKALRAIADREIALSRSGVLLFMNGIDHMEANPTVPAILDRTVKELPDIEFKHATLSEFMAAIKEASPSDLQVIKGEQRSTGIAPDSAAIVLPNILSSRVYLKIANAHCQHLLERWAEPFSACAALAGTRLYDEGILHTGWKWLLRNHPHDSIGGCSADPVHRQMETRFEWAAEIGEYVSAAALRAITDAIDTSTLADKEAAFFVFNPHNWAVSDTLHLDLNITIEEGWFKRNGLELDMANPYNTLRGVEVVAWDGTPVDCHVRDIRTLIFHRPHMEGFGPHYQTARLAISISATDIPALGCRGYRIRKAAKRNRLTPRTSPGNPARLQNDHMTVEFAPNGTLSISGPVTGGETLAGLHYLEDGGDNGDGYTYSPPRHDELVSTLGGPAQITLLYDTPAEQAVAVDYTLMISASVTADRQHRSDSRVPLAVRSIFRLGADSTRLDVETTLTNTASDHRLRVCFDAPSRSDTHFAEMQFDIVERPNAVKQPPGEVWIEDMPLEQPCHGFVSHGSLAVVGTGLHEYEIAGADSDSLKLTLYRAVNYLGAGHHPNTIVGGGGPMMETPDQQLLGRKITFRYAIIPHTGDWKAAQVDRQAAQHNTVWQAVTTYAHPGHLPADALSFVSVSGDGIQLSALKQVEGTPGDYILRIWNNRRTPSKATITWLTAPTTAHMATLAENILTPLPLSGNTATLEIGPASIETIRFGLSDR